MKIAVMSDIHANLDALQAVWEDLQAQAPDQVYCLGDMVGYGAYPNEVIQFVRAQQIPTVMGNYDEGVGYDLNTCGCAYKEPAQEARGHRSLLWTREHTTDEHKRYLRSLPMQLRLGEQKPRVLMVHGSPRRINEYLYQERPRATFERLARVAGAEILLFGHTHLPYEKTVAGMHFVNTGSVGKPKDGDPRAGYVLLQLGRRPNAVFRRVEYDVEAAARAIRETNLPREFALDLEGGGRIVHDESRAKTPGRQA